MSHTAPFLPSFDFHASISFGSILRKTGSILPSGLPGFIVSISPAEFQSCLCTLSLRASCLQIFSAENGMYGANRIAKLREALTEMYSVVGAVSLFAQGAFD